MGAFDEKNRSKKSRASLPLRGPWENIGKMTTQTGKQFISRGEKRQTRQGKERD